MSKMTRNALIALALLLSLSAFTGPGRFDTAPIPLTGSLSGMTLLAHAGGGIPEGKYSNTLEAFKSSVRHNYKLIETDFSWTKSGELVLTHDWGQRHYEYYSSWSFLAPALAPFFPQQAKTRADFMAIKMNMGLHQMDLAALLSFMRAHPGKKIVTDIKENNIKALTKIAKLAGDLKSRFIPQIYAPGEYNKVKALGYEAIIFTAYRSPLSDAALVEFLGQNKLFALTIPARRVSAKLVKAAKAHNTPVFTHTLNTKKEARKMADMDVAGIYTDYLVPAR